MNRKALLQELLHDMRSLQRIAKSKQFCNAHTHTITPGQWHVLFLIKHASETTVKTIAEHLGVTSSAATQLVEGLVRAGYVLRKADPKDRRRVVLTLSRSGSSFVTRVRAQVEKNAQQLFSSLTDAELTQYAALTKKLMPKQGTTSM